MSTFIKLRDQAEQEIRAHIRSTSPDATHHFVVDSTNYFVQHGAVLLAALRLWAEPRQKTDADLQALIDSANAATLENIAEELAENRNPNSTPACSLKALLTHLHASCTTHSNWHGRAFIKTEIAEAVPDSDRKSSQDRINPSTLDKFTTRP